MSAEAKHPIKQGAIIGGWLCFALGTAIMYLSLWPFFIYGPLLLAAFILSIAAMSQRRLVGGILLLLTTLLVPPVQWFCEFNNRGAKYLPGYEEAEARRKLIKEVLEKPLNAPAEREEAVKDAATIQVQNLCILPSGKVVLNCKNISGKPVKAFNGKWFVFDDFNEISRSGDILFSSETVVLMEAPLGRYVIPANGTIVLFEDRNQRGAVVGRMASEMVDFDDLPPPLKKRFKASITDLVFDADRQEPEVLPVLPPPSVAVAPVPSSRTDAPTPNKTASPTPDAPPPLEPFTEIDEKTAPIVFQLKAPRPVPIETIAQDLLGNSYEDEFSRRNQLQNLERSIGKRIRDAKPEDLYRITASVELGEYDFDKNAFLIGRIESRLVDPKVITLFHVAEYNIGKDFYVIHPTNAEKLANIPVKLEEAESLAPALRRSRSAKISYIGTLEKCAETKFPNGNPIKILGLKITEMQLMLSSGQSISYKLPKEDTSVPIELADPPTIPPRPRVLTIPPKREPQQAATVPAPVVTATESDAIPTPPATPPIYVVVGVTPGDFLNVRSEPAMNSNAVFKLTNGDKVQVTGQSAYNGDTEWLPITANSQKGWVRNKYLRLQSK